MPLSVFNLGNPMHPYSWEVDLPLQAIEFAGGGEQRIGTLSRELRVYNLRFRRSEAQRVAWDAFFQALGWRSTSFLWKDLKDSTRGSGSPGLVPLTLVSGTTWKLPTTGQFGGDYPINDSNVLVWDDTPSARTVTSVDTDARTITVASNGSGNLMADYHYYRRVRLRDPYVWNEPVFGVFYVEVAFLEVVPNG